MSSNASAAFQLRNLIVVSCALKIVFPAPPTPPQTMLLLHMVLLVVDSKRLYRTEVALEFW